ncbi:mitochondrial translation elongation factor-like protein G [Glonium stellatum]|uniref:Ribosome-releasing factor 2, mitochondrial n=1 Tax=Glonium stellatum TaxID=574774 RepID=A0A8E2JVX8_9PEZI|nr:mitochondrial translation elongation factor-like protein G [Glonium stellatum]
MRREWAWRACQLRLYAGVSRRLISESARLHTPQPPVDLRRTRNIGIIAHIDAGKTTTTERMLYYSGYTRRIGDVDEGSTVTDFLPAERARGITIQSAAISFHWPPPQEPSKIRPIIISDEISGVSGNSDIVPRSTVSHNINLIDTPGHADFTFEVLRSLRILDGAVCILDGVAGVEAQTEKVWTQADHYKIPRIVYVNKLDRDGAAFSMTVKEIGVRLHGWPAVCQIPWWKDGKGKLTGVGDVVGLRGLLWEGGDGKSVRALDLEELEKIDQAFAAEIKKARIALVEVLSEYDDVMVEKFLDYGEDHIAIPAIQITEALRRCVLQSPQIIIPVFAGASFRNIGVQPLLDAVVDLLPSPEERPNTEISIASQRGTLQEFLTGKLAIPQPSIDADGKHRKVPKHDVPTIKNLQGCALAFKVVNDPKRGVLVYVRVYSGSIEKNVGLFNTNLNVTEKAPRILKMYASDAVEVDSIPAGQIGVIVGLKYARTGDTLISYSGANHKTGPPAPLNTLQLRPIAVPPPVFFTSVEPNSLSEEKHVLDSLSLLLREDPSLQVSVDSESGQTHLAGMGELHLEIARDRLLEDFKAKATTGNIEISYREAITTPSESFTEQLNRDVAGKYARASCTASVSPLDESTSPVHSDTEHQTILSIDSNRVIIHHPTITKAGLPTSSEQPPLPSHLHFSAIISAFQAGVSAALARGPKHGFAVQEAQIDLHLDPSSQIFSETTSAALSTVVRQAVHVALKDAVAKGGSVLMEPVMLVTISVNESSLGSVVHDISSARGGQVVSLDGDSTTGSNSSNTAAQGQDDLVTINPDRIYTPPDPFQSSSAGQEYAAVDRQRQITARVPLKEMVGYLNHLRSLTGGRGTFVMTVDGFERMSSHRQKDVLNEMRGDIA